MKTTARGQRSEDRSRRTEVGGQKTHDGVRSSDLRALACGTGGWTLVEMMVSVGLFSLMLAMLGALSVFGLRSFVAIGNYSDLDARSRSALDLMSRDLRQAGAVVFASATNDVTKWFTVSVTNADTTVTYITYTWDPAMRTLTCANTTRSNQVYLTDCDSWDFHFYQRWQNSNSPTLAFFPATNSSGTYDLRLVKLIDMSWKCSRTLLGKKWNTESVQTAQFVLRNKQ